MYEPERFNCVFLTFALYLGLQLIKLLYDFKKIVAVEAESALDILELRLWYLTEEMIFLAFLLLLVPPEVHRKYSSNALMSHIQIYKM